MEYKEYNYCPLTEKEESIIDCMENDDIADRFIPERFKQKPNWKEICNKCSIRIRLNNE